VKVNSIYNELEIAESGLKPSSGTMIDNKVYKKQNNIYLFEEIGKNKLRLHSIINEKSFYL